jgi:UDP:flavonoid glycosyltransferase YjiC (YdhE family)
VLDGCSAVIHHGGFGSFAAALVAGVPQLVVTTRISDHVLRARRLADAGAGLYLASGGLRPEAVRDAVARLVDEPGFAKGAAAARAEALAHPAPSEIVGRLTGA